MKHTKKILFFKLPFIIILLVLCTIASCKKDKVDDDPNPGSKLISFSHLEADTDTLYIGQKTKIRAVYEGNDVKFAWTASAGDILGSGYEIEFIAPVCASGSNTVSCKASAENTSIEHSIVIYVH